MKRVWKVVGIIILAAVVLGCVCVAVGIFTGADYDRIYSVLDARYHIKMWTDYGLQVIEVLAAQL